VILAATIDERFGCAGLAIVLAPCIASSEPTRFARVRGCLIGLHADHPGVRAQKKCRKRRGCNDTAELGHREERMIPQKTVPLYLGNLVNLPALLHQPGGGQLVCQLGHVSVSLLAGGFPLPYQPLSFGSHVPEALSAFVRGVIDPRLSEFRFLLTVHHPEQGPRGSLQGSLAALLLVTTDGAAQLLHPGSMDNGKRFKEFLKQNCPWELDAPDGLTVDEACEFLWDEARCPLLHRFGLRAIVDRQTKALKYGRMFTNDDAGVTQLECLVDDRPYSEPSIKRDAERTVLWIDSFYWALRIAIQRSINTPEKADRVLDWINSGQWDPIKRRQLKNQTTQQ
jgi:hypothetical protein